MDIQTLYPMNINYRYYDLEYFFKQCQKADLHNGELWLCPQHFLINSHFCEEPRKLKELMERYEVRIRCITPEQNNPKPSNIAARSSLLTEYTQNYFKRVIDLAYDLQCGIVLVTPGWNYHDEEPAAARRRAIVMLRRLCEYASDYGIVLAMETIWRPSSRVAWNIERAAEMMEGVGQDNFKLTLDLGAMGDADETIEQWFAAFGNRIVHCHFVDGTPTGHMPWGHGARSMKADLADFYRNGYEGGFSMEYVHPMSFHEPERFLAETRQQFIQALYEITTKSEKGGN